jgi:intracellular septation protein A
MTPDIPKAIAWLRTHGLRIGAELLVNFIGPFLIFRFARRDLGDVNALIASSAPPIAWSLVEFLRRRRVDALSILVLAGIALSLLAFLGGGSVRFLQLREKLVTVLIGLVFLGSAAIGRPLIYQLARASIHRRSPSEAGEFEALRDNAYFRRTMMIMTLVWGFGLVLEAAVSALLVFRLPIQTYLLVGPIVGYGTMGALTAWTFWYARRTRRIGDARRAAAAAGDPNPSG